MVEGPRWRLRGRHPGVKIKLYSIPFANYVNQLTVRFAGDNPPDIVHLPTRNFASFAAQGWLEPLDAELKATDIPGKWSRLQSEMNWNGKSYGVLLLPYGNLLYYNEQILRDAKIKVPTTPDEWLEAMAKTTHRDQGVFGLVTTTAEHPNMFIDAATWVLGQNQDWLKDNRYHFTDPGVVAALEQFRRSLSYAPPGMNSEAARPLFLEGKAAFLRDGPWSPPVAGQNRKSGRSQDGADAVSESTRRHQQLAAHARRARSIEAKAGGNSSWLPHPELAAEIRAS